MIRKRRSCQLAAPARELPCWRCGLVVCLMALALAPAARADTFGDIDIVLESEPRGESWHGYFEYAFIVTNRSRERAHTVSLSLPGEKYILRGDYLRDVRRTEQVGAKQRVRITLLQPDYPPIGGSGLAITIDDHRQEREVMLKLNETQYRGYSYYGSRSSRFPPGGNTPLVLRSHRVTKNFPLPSKVAPAGGGMVGMPMAVRPPLAGAMPPTGLSPNTQVVTLEPLESWSSNWLAYSRYDGIVVSGEDLKGMPPAVRTALWQYVETGGSLLVLGKADLRGLSVAATHEKEGCRITEAGFGQCLSSSDDNIDRWDPARLMLLGQSWRDTAAPWQEETRRR